MYLELDTQKLTCDCVKRTNFTNCCVEELLSQLQMKQHLIAKSAPRSNRKLERYVSTVLSFDKKLRTTKVINVGDFVFHPSRNYHFSKLDDKYEEPFEVLHTCEAVFDYCRMTALS